MSALDEQDALRVTAEEFDDGATSDLGDIEIVDGRVVPMMAQSPLHSRVVRRLAGLFEAARRPGGARMVVDSDVAARFADSESASADRRLNIRNPDIWIRDCEPYLIVRLDQKEERIEEIEEYRLDWSGRCYRAHHVHRRVLLLDDPVEATIPFEVLEQA
ncbi:Uma2 family endonuclease [Nocardia tengchongensis]|uniref:Uma2 family endonuclease n=1 Tax=Nocardia tengchongensis TaxID=2055889 RepID=UPI0036B53943